jgi:hypothetical protein
MGYVTVGSTTVHLASKFLVEASDNGVTNWRPIHRIALHRCVNLFGVSTTNLPLGATSYNPGAAEIASQILKPYDVMFVDRVTSLNPQFNRIVKWTAATLVELEDPLSAAFVNGVNLHHISKVFRGVGLQGVNYIRAVYIPESTDGSDNLIATTSFVDCQFSHVTGIV